MTVDAACGIVYSPFATPAFDRYGGDRKGDGLYGTSLIAADARTGKYLWHFRWCITTSGTMTSSGGAAVWRESRR